MSRFFTPTLASLEPYTPGEQPKLPNLVKLNANENPYPPAPGVAEAVAAVIPGLRLYSDLTARTLCEAIAAHWGVAPECILCGNGSDENLLLALRAFCDETHPAAFADITYSFYAVLCDLMHIPTHILPLRQDFTIDLTAYHGLGETIVIANPNAPTSLLAPVQGIEEVLRTNPDNVVIVDETYVEFAPDGSSCVSLLDRYDNLVITHTFSKTHNLAGARLGYCIASPALIADMNRVKFSYSPYNVNAMTQAAGTAAIRDEAYFRDVRGRLLATRDDTTRRLRERGFTVEDSATNFLFVTTDRMPCRDIFTRLRERGILIRYFDAPRLSDHLRITIGTPDQMERFFAALDEILGHPAQ
ncbi:MAG: histidinol-phosphate transaminase [Gemmiger sp.]|uniref:pyridoxal phosphate-dependent aminotransferase n=1 Tax=Gemmiger sp. TaxID=2049027 RepID=UPI002E77E76D|nr:histidinol-phosphate transaminase [Gemmiger sp.]MEE0801638.1 histidinol-phosphate transaminase [Gemmiger sp.]